MVSLAVRNRVRTVSIRVLGVCLLLFVFGCDQQGQGFNLPKGNVEQGRMTFILLQCNACHSVTTSENSATKGIEWDGVEDGVHVVLGGQVTRIKTYGDLVTSIINPNHKLSRGLDKKTITEDGTSKMRVYNEIMSVQELIDLVSYLESKYEIWIPDYYQY
jgi:sulfur-oxidizing protein SoxX